MNSNKNWRPSSTISTPWATAANNSSAAEEHSPLVIDAYRACLMGDPIPNPIGLVVAALIAIFVFYFGWKVFHRAEFKFAEYV